MLTLDDDVYLQGQNIDVNTMSGNVNLSKCVGDVNTMSGDIDLIYHGGHTVNTMSGDIDIDDSEIKEVNSMSGDIRLCDCNIGKVTTVSGLISIQHSNINVVECSRFVAMESKIETLILRDPPEKKKWWNPFTWNTTISQTQICGNNSMCIQINGNTHIKNGKCVRKSRHKRVVEIRSTDVDITVVEFDNGRTDNIFRSANKVTVKNGTWEHYGVI